MRFPWKTDSEHYSFFLTHDTKTGSQHTFLHCKQVHKEIVHLIKKSRLSDTHSFPSCKLNYKIVVWVRESNAVFYF